ncbi:3-mercaptopyruvate sulfurtransferase [Oceanibacterium hippocampi]|uniref:3-mercaptopyruvate sulfurtransferase n=1 Tax=Oceanibacterium hippocampi TaxID=745714 RepID=A0A1Y5SWB8_9PROT|nr:3-mercaptopyruvate sulfurtransferase [Oceanibacterium hippocampi]SLN49963.1 3-mercaptopyruvate sulfurtransferase [Oceanibacterium hippocampi]
MSYANPSALVSTDWLAEHMNAPDIRIVDGSWHMPHLRRDARAEYEAEHIPGAVFFDIDEIADSDSTLPHMLPSPEKFASRVRRLGLGDGNRIVVYDSNGCVSAARVWWMFRIFGHSDVAVLDGGLPKWLEEGRPTENRPTLPRERHFSARFNTMLVRDVEQVQGLVGSDREQILDARSAGRFAGIEAEPRAGLRSGHMPGAKNLPYGELFNPDGTFLSADALRTRFEQAGIGLGRPVVTTCGSGITACVLALGLHLLGHRDTAVYDGSWTEWGGRDDTPVETGA